MNDSQPLNRWITIGVVGKCRLPVSKVEALRTGLRLAMDNVRVACPHSEIRLLTSLSVGADRLAAEVALELGIPVQAIFPLPPKIYDQIQPSLEADFWSSSEYPNASCFLNQPDKRIPPLVVTELGLQHLDLLHEENHSMEAFLGNDAAAKARRHRHYALAGLFIALRANHLIAVYDKSETVAHTYGPEGIVSAKTKGALPKEAFRRHSDWFTPPRGIFSTPHLDWNWSDCGVVERVWFDANGKPDREYIQNSLHADAGEVLRPPTQSTRASFQKIAKGSDGIAIHWDALLRIDDLHRHLYRPALRWPKSVGPAPFRRGDEPDKLSPETAGLLDNAVPPARMIIDQIARLILFASVLPRLAWINATAWPSLRKERTERSTRNAFEHAFGSVAYGGLNVSPEEESYFLRLFAHRIQIAAHARSKRAYQRYLVVWMFLFTLGGAISYQVFAKFGFESWEAWAGYFVLFSSSVFIHRLLRRSRVDDQVFDFRAIAEALRITIIWRLIQLPGTPLDYFLERHVGDLGWIRSFVMHLHIDITTETLMSNAGSSLAPVVSLSRIKAVVGNERQSGWVNEQTAYFLRESANRSQMSAQGSFFSEWGLVAGVTGAVIGGLALMLMPDSDQPEVMLFGVSIYVPLKFLLIAASTIAIGGGIWGAYLRGALVSEERNACASMLRVYQQGITELDCVLASSYTVSDVTCRAKCRKAKIILKRLLVEALAENAEWLTLHRARRFGPLSGL